MTYTDQDNGASLSLTRGETFAVRLTENPTTGYHWDLANWDQSMLEVIRDEFHPREPAGYGAGGEHRWEFVARASGQCTLRLVYRRRWESAAPAKTFSLDVSVT